jgi:hypothetical protein
LLAISPNVLSVNIDNYPQKGKTRCPLKSDIPETSGYSFSSFGIKPEGEYSAVQTGKQVYSL